MERKKARSVPAAPLAWPWLPLIGAMLVAIVPGRAIAQSILDVKLLTPRECRQLSREARKIYDQAVKELDHVNPVRAIELFDKASAMSPDAIELHFLTARLAYLRARRQPRDEAKKYYDMALKALERIGKHKDLSPLVRRRYETRLKQITEESKKLEVREQRRMAIGLLFRKIYAKEIYGEEKEKFSLRPTRLVPPRQPSAPTAATARGMPTLPARARRPAASASDAGS